ncbi:MAG TPA: hypothetical protein VEX13_06330 [Chloroflexia bacterium]|nr:hypothetical protein [Chloroflexia bacterium]
MGASVIAYWPGITAEQIEEQPGFYNDCKAWGDWMAERERESDVIQILRDLGAGSLLTFTTDGLDDNDVEWVTPQELQAAAQRLRRAVEEGTPGIERILEVYERNANRIDPVPEEFAQDLLDIAELAKWAEIQGAYRMTLEVNW